MRLVHLALVGLLAIIGVACTPAERHDAGEAAQSVGATAEALAEDGTVTAAVKAKLLAEPAVSGMRIDVDTRESVVTLSGQVANAAAKQRAVELARGTEGVTRVEDKLIVAQ